MSSKKIVSNELFSKVLNIKDFDSNKLVYLLKDWNQLVYTKQQEEFSINIYEFLNKCKEFIVDNQYVLKICYVLENDTRDLAFIETTLLKSNQYSSDYYDMDSKTEIEAVIKACEWILKEKLVLID